MRLGGSGAIAVERIRLQASSIEIFQRVGASLDTEISNVVADNISGSITSSIHAEIEDGHVNPGSTKIMNVTMNGGVDT